MKVTARTNLFSHMYYLPVLCTFTIDFDQFELQRSLIRINLLPRSSELQVLGIWRRSSELLVFRIFGTCSSESSSPQKLEMFIRTSGLHNLWHLIRNATSEAGTVHQNFLSQNLQLGFWESESESSTSCESPHKLTCIRVRN